MFPVSDVIPPRRTPYATLGLIAANTAAFVYQRQLDAAALYDLARTIGVVPAQLAWPTLATSTFFHDAWIHLATNALFLWIFGANVEDRLGRGAYLLFYLSAGAAVALGYSVLVPAATMPLVGAGGAVAAIIAAHLALYPKSQVLTLVFFDVIEIPAIFFIGIWLLVQLLNEPGAAATATTDPGIVLLSQSLGFALGVLAGVAFRRKARAWE